MRTMLVALLLPHAAPLDPGESSGGEELAIQPVNDGFADDGFAMQMPPEANLSASDELAVMPEANGKGKSATNICMWDSLAKRHAAVPSLFLLGCRKCGTTSYAKVMKDAGIVMMASAGANGEATGEKEWHYFDACVCGRTTGCHNTDHTHLGMGITGSCSDVANQMTDAVQMDFVHANTYNCEEPGSVCDATPENMRLVDLHHVLHGLYHGYSSRLSFVMLLREPLSRMHSDYYYHKNHGGDPPMNAQTFSKFVEMLSERLPKDYDVVKNMTNHGELSVGSPDVDFWYTSMYGLQLKPWLDQQSHFKPEQFVILPMRWGMEHTDEAFELLATKYPRLSLNTSGIPEKAPHMNDKFASQNPTLDEDLSFETRTTFRRNFFNEDTSALADLLFKGMVHGLSLGGYTGDHRHMSSRLVEDHLKNWW
jgi:hypothetical protein